MAEEMEAKPEPQTEPLTAAKVALWMNTIVENKGQFRQKEVTYHLAYRNPEGKKFLHKNKNGNWAINEDVLEEFNKLNMDTVVWSFSKRHWRKRRKEDPPGRQVK